MKKNIIFLVLLLTSCIYSKKQEDGFYHYSYCTAISGEESEYHLLKKTSINENDTINLTIKIVDKRSQEYFNFPAFIEYSDSNKKVNMMTKSDSITRLELLPNIYSLKVSCIGYNDLHIDKLLLEKDNHTEILVEMGEANGFADYNIKSKWKLTKLQLKCRIKKLER
ncbi:hypothetical protein [Flammeovirga agarivorans]|uniref:Lipoprotein n=1 Tax=Flammeovirga agarivorans TaxID=2726742 RepID=A0A7X8SRL0_9BACT|nr:hypothetical protein [Flammeovirga agarivorans]NLR95127.1 hypothetical protein [Flammeovirga agarivorans]